MTSQFDFTNNEWNDIATLPVLIGYAMARAEDSGRLGSFREMRTMVSTITSKAPDSAARGLIEAVSTVDVKAKVDQFEDHDTDLLADIAVMAAAEMSKVLDDKAQPDETAAFKQWLLDLALDVANTAKEDGRRVSNAEAELLDRLKVALV